VDALHDYLRIEYQAKRPDRVSTNPFNHVATRAQILRVPQQNNSVDCGVFLLKYAECFMKVKF
jgi:Ulp1 family protease